MFFPVQLNLQVLSLAFQHWVCKILFNRHCRSFLLSLTSSCCFISVATSCCDCSSSAWWSARTTTPSLASHKRQITAIKTIQLPWRFPSCTQRASIMDTLKTRMYMYISELVVFVLVWIVELLAFGLQHWWMILSSVLFHQQHSSTIQDYPPNINHAAD